MKRPNKEEENFGIPYDKRLLIYENYCVKERGMSQTARICHLCDKKVSKYIKSKGWERPKNWQAKKNSHPWRRQIRAALEEKIHAKT